MGGVFKKAPEAPDPPAPAAIPDKTDDAEEFALKEERRRSGSAKTFLTGNVAPKSTGRKTTLG